jgi:uncharacterized protein YfaS (alpha-2-macroglobulin family)
MSLTRVCGRFAKLPLFILLAASLSGQGENDAYFALSSSKSFGSGDATPTISLNGWNVESLDFRVYRINDPRLFFQQLERPHEFGGQAPAPPHERTLIENLRAWKRSLHANIRRSLRAQFTESPSAQVKSFLPHKAPAVNQPAVNQPAAVGDASRYAEAPLLNPQQLVMAFSRPVRGASRWDREDVEVPVTEKGVYLVEAVHHDLRAYTVLFVSDLVMVSKSGKGRIVNFVVDRKTGQPVPDIEVEALNKKGAGVTARTDRDGSAEIKSLPGNGEFTLLAHKGRDYAVNSVGWDGAGADEWMGYLYTDRPIYRPGHTVHFKGLLRLRATDGYDVPAGRKVSVEIQDPDQKPVYQKTLTVSPSGAIFDDLVLAPGVALGNYYIEVKPVAAGGQAGEENGYVSGNFEVQAYRKPEYEVRVTPSKTRVLQGETVQAVIDALYFFGEPVSGAKVKYSVYRSRYWFPLWYDPDDEAGSDSGDGGDGGDNADSDNGGDQLTDQDGVLDADGKLTINVATSTSEKSVDFLYRVEAKVTDAANREISGAGRIVATYGSFVLNIAPERYVYEPGATANVTIQARDYDLHPIQTHAHVELARLYSRGKEQTISSTDVNTDANGDVKTSLQIPKQGGSYRIHATARTPEGRDVIATDYLWITGGTWAREAGGRENISIVTDQKTYKAGDTAKLLLASVQPGAAVYVSVEGRDIRQVKLIHAQGSTASFEVPVEAKYEPGFTVAGTFVKDGTQYSGAKYIRVPPVDHQLNIKVATDKPQYLPGETASYSLDVSDHNGKPVPGAELSVGVVDEAIYGVRPDATPNILNFFFGHDYNRVYMQSSLQYSFFGQAGKRRMQLAELRPRSRLAQLKPERLVQPKVRKAFPDTAFWAPTVVTDSGGHAQAKVDYPDSLTTWRATARGITKDTSVGSAVLKTVVRKNLILRLTTPRFLVQGDEITISALVHNYLATAKTARVSLDVQGLEILSGKSQDITIPSRGEGRVDWRIKAGKARTATLTGKALTDEESDALELELPINFPGVKLNSSKGGSVTGGNAADFVLQFPDSIEAGSRSITVGLAPSIAGSLFSALEYLTSFPYGCVEQTMSSFLPDIVVKDVIKSLSLKTDIDEAGLQEKIHAGLERLYAFQHPDGGWGWWETDDSHPFMTAYVVAGLMQAQGAGTQVNMEAVNKGVQWLQKDLAADSKLTADFRAYLIYSLTVAGRIDNEELNSLYQRRSNLTPYGLAIFGLALENAKDARAGEIAASLEAAVTQTDQEAYWQAKRDPMLDFDTDASPEATAFATRFLSHQKKDSPLLPKAALWLLNHRNEGYWWSSTKQTAMVIYGLTDYLKSSNELKPNLSVTVFVNEKPALTRKLDAAAAVGAPDLVLDESKLQPGANRIRIATTGEGRVYYGARAQYYSSAAHFQKTGTVSLNLLRDYFRLVPGKNGEKIVYDLAPLDGAVSPGDIVAVRLTATGSEWKYVMLEDPIPAGTEFIEKDGLYEMRTPPSWWNYFFSRRELHDDHMAIFQTWFRSGQHEYFYLLKVVNPGLFQAGPARIGPMYQNDVMATTEGRRLEVKQ